MLSGWQRNLAAFIAGTASALAMAPFDLFPILFLTIPVLVWLMDGASSEPGSSFLGMVWEGFKPGFFFGFGYFLGGLWWIGSALLVDGDTFAWVLPIAVIAFPAFLGVFWGIGTAFARLFWRGDVSRVYMLAGSLMLVEYFRGFAFTGFPWNTLGYAAYFNVITFQTASLIGIYPMTGLVVLVAALPVFAFPGTGKRLLKHSASVLMCALLIASHAGFGLWRIETTATGFADGIALRLVQPAIAQEEKFDPAKEASLFGKYLELSTEEKNGRSLSDVTHLIWPESAFPFLLTERKDALASIAAMLPEGTSLVTGAARAEQSASNASENLVFNSVYVIDSSGVIVSAADKVHLVPFGEYLPFQNLAESLGIEQLTKVQGGFSPGNARKMLTTGTGPSFLPLVCYEIIFSGSIWNQTDRPGFLVNLTNDAWFGMTPGPYQHERQAIVRTVEEGIPLVRVANTGISGVYDSLGQPIARLELSESGILDADLPLPADPTFFTGHGNSIFWSFLSLFFGIGLLPIFRP